jgi:hypothetical protein
MPVLITFTFFAAILLCSVTPYGRPLWTNGYPLYERVTAIAYVLGMWFIMSTISLLTFAIIAHVN